MKTLATDKNNEAAIEKSRIRRWILKAVETSSEDKNGVTLQRIKKFLDTKQSGISAKPDFKLTLKKLLDTGHLMKIDRGKYAVKKPSLSSNKAKNATSGPKSAKKSADGPHSTKKSFLGSQQAKISYSHNAKKLSSGPHSTVESSRGHQSAKEPSLGSQSVKESSPSPNGAMESSPSPKNAMKSSPSPNGAMESSASPNGAMESSPSPNGAMESSPGSCRDSRKKTTDAAKNVRESSTEGRLSRNSQTTNE